MSNSGHAVNIRINSAAGATGQDRATTSDRPLSGQDRNTFTSELIGERTFCIVGDSAAGIAITSLLSVGREIQPATIWTNRAISDTVEQRAIAIPSEFEVRKRKSSVSCIRGACDVRTISESPEETLKSARGVIVVANATEYGVVATQLAPHLQDGQTVYLVSAPLCGGLQFASLLNSKRRKLQVDVVELGTLFDSAHIESGVLLVSGVRDRVTICGNSRNATRRGMPIASALCRGLVPASNVMERGLGEVERILRPALLLVALMSGRDVNRLASLVNPQLVSVLAGLNQEVQQLAKVFKCVVPDFVKSIKDYVLSDVDDLTVSSISNIEDAISWLGESLLGVLPGQIPIVVPGHTNASSGSSSASDSEDFDRWQELLKRDVTEMLVLLADFARLARVQAPVINSLIDLSSAITHQDLAKKGRKVDDLGLVGFDTTEIIELINE